MGLIQKWCIKHYLLSFFIFFLNKRSGIRECCFLDWQKITDLAIDLLIKRLLACDKPKQHVNSGYYSTCNNRLAGIMLLIKVTSVLNYWTSLMLSVRDATSFSPTKNIIKKAINNSYCRQQNRYKRPIFQHYMYLCFRSLLCQILTNFFKQHQQPVFL